MMFADRVFHPFEKLIEPFRLPIATLPDKGPLQLVWYFAKMFRCVLVAVTLLSIVSASISLYVVWMLAYIVDGIVSSGADAFVGENLILLIGFAVLLLLVDPVISFVDRCLMSQTVQTLLPAAMRWQAHKAVEQQDVAFFEDIFAGQVASRIEQVTRSVQQQLLTAIERIPHFFIQFFGSLGLLFVLSWQLAIPVVAWIVANALLSMWVTPKLIDKSSKVAEASSRATGAMTDVYSNISIVKAFSAETAEGNAIRDVLTDTVNTRHREKRLEILTFSAVNIINALLSVAIFVVGIWGLTKGFVTIGDFVAAATITRGLFYASFAFISLGFSISESYGTIRDAMPVMTTQPTLQDKIDATPFLFKRGEIVFDNVSYSYLNEGKTEDRRDSRRDDERDNRCDDRRDDTLEKESTPPKTVIRDMDLIVSPGEKVGLVGLSGAGKSTVISLLLRLRDVEAGSITVDGQDVRDVKQHSLRKEIGLISQDIFLLNRSIRENVRYGAASANDEQISEALHIARALDFVEGLQDKEGRSGLDAYVGDRGIKLSGGQRQRLAIARVVLKNANILLLDEATSALDSEVETEIQQNLQQVMMDKTVVVVAHRLSTIAAMDRLVVLEEGKITEQGNHRELIRQNGLYARLWQRQSGGFIAA